MIRCRKLLTDLLFPPLPAVILLAPVSAGLLVYVFTVGNTDTWLAYGAYALSAYALALVCARAPNLYRHFSRIQELSPHIRRYRRDASLRVTLSLSCTLAGNLVYALLQLCLGFLHHSIWFYALAGYYALLSAMRSLLLREARKGRLGKALLQEYRLCRLCGLFLVPMNLTLAVVVSFMVWQNRGFSYPPIATIALAAYTFFSLTMAIVQMVRYRKYNSPVMSASKHISLVAALVSMLSLETAMLSAFGTEGDALFRQIITAATGGAVCIAVLAIALWMIRQTPKELHPLKGEFHHGTQ